jgi:hypothetical protein
MACEMNLGIICGCLSGVKPVLGVIFPRFFASSYKADSRPTYNRTGHTTHAESFPFQTLSDVSNTNKARDRKIENTADVDEIDMGGKGTGQGNFVAAWASASGDTDYLGPEGVIGVESTVEVREEEGLSPKSGRSRKGSEEWIMEQGAEPLVR